MVISSLTRNIPALDVILRMHRTESNLSANITRLSSGLRINTPADSPGDFVTLSRLGSRIRGIDQASLNSQTASNMAATASNGISEMISRLQSIRTKAVAAASTGTSDRITRAGYQAEINQLIDDMDRIASGTSFNGKNLLDGSYASSTEFVEPNRFNGSISFGATSSTLRSGTSILNIVQLDPGSERFVIGDTGGISLGIQNRTDIAVSIGQLIDMGTGLTANVTDDLDTLNFGKVSLINNGTIQFTGNLADGVTAFAGQVSIGGGQDINDLVTAIQAAIDAAETGIGVNGAGTGPYETVVSYDNTTGRLEFTNGQGNTISQFSIAFTVKDNTGTTQTTTGSTRTANIYNPQGGIGTVSGAQIGNSLSSITGSTFDPGTFEITVSDRIAAQQRTISTTYAFTDFGGAPVGAGTNINNTALFNGSITLSLNNGDTIDFTGTNPDGTTFTGTITIAAGDPAVGNGIARRYSDLIAELNYRDQRGTFYGWNQATATLSAGKIQLIDDVAATSSTAMQMVVNTAGGDAVDDGVVVYSGNAERATISIAGGASQTVESGQVVTLEGADLNASGQDSQVTFRVGRNLFDGSDDLEITAQEYIARLNNGPAVTFRNGDQGVFISDGNNPTGDIAGAQQVQLNFDTVLGITSNASSGGENFVLTTVADRLNYHIGPDAWEDRMFSYFNVQSSNLGISETRNLGNISVTTLTGANDAIEVIDAALDQLNVVAGVVGSLETRMQDTSSQLDLYSLNLDTAFSTIADADMAKETTKLAMNSLLMTSQTAALLQSTMLPTEIIPLLLGIDLKS
ncbi:MAG TPA: flagellin [bacterium]|nr:flagellin [bacterium]HQL63368.1 flagellin [bacterium]